MINYLIRKHFVCVTKKEQIKQTEIVNLNRQFSVSMVYLTKKISNEKMYQNVFKHDFSLIFCMFTVKKNTEMFQRTSGELSWPLFSSNLSWKLQELYLANLKRSTQILVKYKKSGNKTPIKMSACFL